MFSRSAYCRTQHRGTIPKRHSLCRIEFVSTLRLIDKNFPREARVCDVASGPGCYSIELIRRGYAVTLLDLSDEEIRLARTQLDELGISAEQWVVGDAQDMSI